jgi:hypothetical protein
MNSEDYAIVVAISTYQVFDPLSSPEIDAVKFREWLTSPQGGQLPPGNIAYISSSQFHPPNSAPGSVDVAQPRLDDVDIAFKKHVVAANSTQRHRVGRRLYIFLSGHGITPGRSATPDLDDTALLMANADLVSLGFHIPGHPYAEWFRTAGAFDELVLFMDCCRDDAGTTAPRNCPFGELKGNRNKVKRFYASATQWGQAAWEDVLEPPSPQKRSFFSFAVLEALNNGICDELGRLTCNVLAGYVKQRVNEMRTNGKPQKPQFLYDPQNDIVLIDRVTAASDNVLVTFGPGLLGAAQLIGPSLTVLDTHPADSAPWSLALQPGFYKIALGQKSQLFEVPAQRGMVNVQFG